MGLFVEASRSDKYHKGPLISPRVFGFDSPLHPCTYMYLVCHSCLSLLSNEDRKRRLFFLFFADLSVPQPPLRRPQSHSLYSGSVFPLSAVTWFSFIIMAWGCGGAKGGRGGRYTQSKKDDSAKGKRRRVRIEGRKEAISWRTSQKIEKGGKE